MPQVTCSVGYVFYEQLVFYAVQAVRPFTISSLAYVLCRLYLLAAEAFVPPILFKEEQLIENQWITTDLTEQPMLLYIHIGSNYYLVSELVS